MGDHDDGLAHLRVQALHHRQNLFGRCAVQIPGRFVGNQKGGIGDDGAGDGDPLLLAAGHLLGIMIHPVLQAHHAQGHFGVLPPFPPGERGQVERQLDVFDRLEHGDKVVELKDEADVIGAPMGELGLRKGGDVDAAHPDRPAVRLVDPGQEVQEGRFPGTGRSHQRQELPFGDVKGDIVQNRDGEVFPVIGLKDIPDFYNGWFRFGQVNFLCVQDNFSDSSGFRGYCLD